MKNALYISYLLYFLFCILYIHHSVSCILYFLFSILYFALSSKVASLFEWVQMLLWGVLTCLPNYTTHVATTYQGHTKDDKDEIGLLEIGLIHSKKATKT